jgi:hypothetical protein
VSQIFASRADHVHPLPRPWPERPNVTETFQDSIRAARQCTTGSTQSTTVSRRSRLIETRATNTTENLTLTRDLLAGRGAARGSRARSFGTAGGSAHLVRADLLGAQQGVEGVVDAVPARIRAGGLDSDRPINNSNTLKPQGRGGVHGPCGFGHQLVASRPCPSGQLFRPD